MVKPTKNYKKTATFVFDRFSTKSIFSFRHKLMYYDL